MCAPSSHGSKRIHSCPKCFVMLPFAAWKKHSLVSGCWRSWVEGGTTETIEPESNLYSHAYNRRLCRRGEGIRSLTASFVSRTLMFLDRPSNPISMLRTPRILKRVSIVFESLIKPAQVLFIARRVVGR